MKETNGYALAAMYVACITFLPLFAGCATTPALNLTSAPATSADLTGNWVVDPSLSEDPIGKIQLALTEQMQRKMPGAIHAGGRGGQAGMMGGDGGGMKSQMQEEVSDLAQRIGGHIELPNRLDITQRIGDMKIVADGHMHDVPIKASLSDDKASFRAGWFGDEFVIVMQTDDAKIVQHYSIMPDHRSLTLLTELKIKKLSIPVTVSRVFVPTEGSRAM